jgi:hypothetical protein
MPAAAAKSRNIKAEGAADKAVSKSNPTSTDWMPARKGSALSLLDGARAGRLGEGVRVVTVSALESGYE